MKSHSFQIELLGGPADGLQLTAGKAPGGTIQMPSGPRPRPKNRTTGRYWAAYELLWRKYDVDASGAAIVRLGYDFVGHRVRRDNLQAKRLAVRLLRMTGLAWLKRSTSGLRKRLASRDSAARSEGPDRPAIRTCDTRTAAIKKPQRIRHP